MFNMTPWGMDRRLPETFLRDDCWMLAGHEKTGSEPRSHGDGLSGLPPAKKRCDKVMSTQLVWCFMMSRRTVSQRCSPKSSRQNRHHSDSFLGVEKQCFSAQINFRSFIPHAPKMLQLVAIVIFESFQLQFRMASACHQPGVILELPKRQVFFTVHSGVMICALGMRFRPERWELMDLDETSEMPELVSMEDHPPDPPVAPWWLPGVLLGALLTSIVSAGMAAFSKGGKALRLRKMTLSDLVQWSIGTTKFSLALKASYLARLLGFLAPRGCKIPGLSRPVWM